jgi:hypothetical protein
VGLVSSELDDRWVLAMRGLTVSAASIDQRCGKIRLSGEAEMAFSAPAYLTQGPLATSASARPGEVYEEGSRSISELEGARLLSAVAFKSGSLRMVFSSGTHLTCLVPRPGQFVLVSFDGSVFKSDAAGSRITEGCC